MPEADSAPKSATGRRTQMQGKPAVFTTQEVDQMRAALDQLRSGLAYGGSYESGRWMVSSFNRRPDVVGGKFPKVVIRDITLRTTEQLAGVELSSEERLAFLRGLVNAGVRSIQLSAFRRGHTVEQMKAEVDAVKGLNPDCETVYGAATSVADVKMAAEAGIDAIQIWTAFLGAGAPACAGAVYHRSWERRDWHDLGFPTQPQDQIDRSVRMVQMGSEHGVRVAGSINLLSYASEKYIEEYTRSVVAAGAYEVDLADGSSGCGPEAFTHAVGLIKSVSPEVRVCVHTHNMFGLAIANAVAAAKAGAAVLEVAVNEYEHGATQADLAGVVMALEALYGVETGVTLDQLVPLARLAESITRQPISDHHPITGRRVFESAGSDEYVQEYKYDPLIHCALNPSVVGASRSPAISHETGPFTMWDKLDEVGVAVDSSEDVEDILALCQLFIAEHKREITDVEISQIASKRKSLTAPRIRQQH
jgi:isopropylmalate/homocitrate/citramalate synthase